MLKWYWYVHVLFKQRLELLAEYKDAPGSQVEDAQQKISEWKERVKKLETKENELENNLKLQNEGLFW